MAAEDKRSSGQPFKPPPATMWNAMVSAGEVWQAGQLGEQQGGSSRARPTDILQIKNVSGAARVRGDVLGAFANPLTNLERDNIRLSGTAPTAGGHVGVCLEPMANGTYGPVQLSGVCVAKVNVSDADHEFAAIDPGEYVLVSAAEGQIGIVYAPAGTGVLSCVVRLGGGGGGKLISVAKVGGSVITARSTTTPGTGTATLQYDNAGTLTAEAGTVTVKNWAGTTVAANAYIVVGKDSRGTWWVLSEDCPAS